MAKQSIAPQVHEYFPLSSIRYITKLLDNHKVIHSCKVTYMYKPIHPPSYYYNHTNTKQVFLSLARKYSAYICEAFARRSITNHAGQVNLVLM